MPFRWTEEIIRKKSQLNTKTCQPLEARENASEQVLSILVLHLIGWEVGLSFLDQSPEKEKRIESNSGLLSTPNKNIVLDL